MKWLFDRISEPSSWGGLAAVMLGLGQLGKIDEAPAVVEGLNQVGQSVAAGANPLMALAIAAAGVASVIIKEKGKK